MSPNKIERAAMEAEALAMRKNWSSFAEIGAKFGMSEAAAWMMVNRVLKRDAEARAKNLDAVREMEINRTEVAMQAVWERVLAGEDGAIKSLDTMMKRKAALLGLDAPAKSAVEVSNPAAEAEARARKRAMAADPEAARLLQELAARQAALAPVESPPDADGTDGDEPDAD